MTIKRRHHAVALVLLIAVANMSFGAEPSLDPWLPLRPMIGEWTGTTSGAPGEGTVSRRYIFVLNDRYIHETNASVYPPQEKNKEGERHEHWGIFSYDKTRKTLVLRQFHVEGFVNTYRNAAQLERPNTLVFESENFENFSNAWKARESYEFVSENEFVETFELAAPGKPFQVYSRNHFKRAGR